MWGLIKISLKSLDICSLYIRARVQNAVCDWIQKIFWNFFANLRPDPLIFLTICLVQSHELRKVGRLGPWIGENRKKSECILGVEYSYLSAPSKARRKYLPSVCFITRRRKFPNQNNFIFRAANFQVYTEQEDSQHAATSRGNVNITAGPFQLWHHIKNFHIFKFLSPLPLALAQLPSPCHVQSLLHAHVARWAGLQ